MTQNGGHFENFESKILLDLNFWELFVIVLSGYLGNFPEKFSFLHFFSIENRMLPHYSIIMIIDSPTHSMRRADYNPNPNPMSHVGTCVQR